MDPNKTNGEKSLTATKKESCEQYWTSPGGNIPQSSSCTATNHPSRKLFKLDEPDMQDTAGEVRTNSLVMYSCGPLHMDEQRQDGQLELTYGSSVPIRDVSLKTCRKQWTIEKGGERGSGISVLAARCDDDEQPVTESKNRINTHVCRSFLTFPYFTPKASMNYPVSPLAVCCSGQTSEYR